MGKNVIFEIEPKAKPRMVRSDKWKKRDIVMAYWEWKDWLNTHAKIFNYEVEPILSIRFEMRMPKYWSNKKRERMNGKPCQKRPDLDNLIKAFKDALCKEDSFVWKYENMEKVWAYEGRIIVKKTI